MKKYILASAVLSLVLAGCTDLDTAPEGNVITADQKAEVVEANPERAEASVTAIFSQFKEYMPNYTALGSCHNDFGYGSIMLETDLDGEDVVSSSTGYNWFSAGLAFDNRVYSSYHVDIVWADFYHYIYAANNVIAVMDPESKDAQIQFYLAQGLAARAFAYLGLAQLFQRNYCVIDPASTPCVPLITDKNATEAAAQGAPRATVAEVAAQIKSDLDQAINLLKMSEEGGYTRADRRYISLAVAYGLRARYDLYIHDLNAAASDAQNAIDNSDARPAQIAEVTQPGFSSASEPDWMWGILVAETDDIVSSGIVNWISHMGTINYGYGWYNNGYRISKKLYETISATDVRKGWFLDENGENAQLDPAYYAAIENNYSPIPAYLNCKFAPYNGEPETSTNANDMPLMRIEEMYLILAEAKQSASLLQEFVSNYRDPAYTCSLTGDELIMEVLRQRRIELWGEGLSWYDIMRYNLGIDRRGCGYPEVTSILNVPAGAPILVWPIPESEIQANPAISESDNNDCINDAATNYRVTE